MPFPDTPAHQRAADARYALTSLTHSPASPFIDPGPVAFIDLLKCGLWMRVGFVGAIAATTGPALLLEGSAGPLTAAVLMVVGAMLAERGLRNATRALDRFDAATDASPAAAGAGVPPGALPPGRPLPAV